jgi:hypoxanthine-DNA glycosylase
MSSIPNSAAEAPDRGFPPVARDDARILVLGSLPGRRSLAAAEYYAHPRNAFWPIMAELAGVVGNYDERCEKLVSWRVALWDVLAEAPRPGSLDAAIRTAAAAPNDFCAFFRKHRRIVRVGFNGQTAARLFERLLPAECRALVPDYRILPSTSPAYAAMPYAAKLGAWREFLDLQAE